MYRLSFMSLCLLSRDSSYLTVIDVFARYTCHLPICHKMKTVEYITARSTDLRFYPNWKRIARKWPGEFWRWCAQTPVIDKLIKQWKRSFISVGDKKTWLGDRPWNREWKLEAGFGDERLAANMCHNSWRRVLRTSAVCFILMLVDVRRKAAKAIKNYFLSTQIIDCCLTVWLMTQGKTKRIWCRSSGSARTRAHTMQQQQQQQRRRQQHYHRRPAAHACSRLANDRGEDSVNSSARSNTARIQAVTWFMCYSTPTVVMCRERITN